METALILCIFCTVALAYSRRQSNTNEWNGENKQTVTLLHLLIVNLEETVSGPAPDFS